MNAWLKNIGPPLGFSCASWLVSPLGFTRRNNYPVRPCSFLESIARIGDMDIKDIEHIIKILKQNEVTEFELEQEGTRSV